MNSTSRKPNRLFSENDEIALLNSVLNPGETPFPDDKFSAAQMADKIRRLKQKYHKFAQHNSSIKTPHDREIYEFARKIWGDEKTRMPVSSLKPKEEEGEEKGSVIATNWSDFPFLMKHVSRAFPGCEEVYKEGLKGLGDDVLKGFDEKWKELDMEEAAIEGINLE